MGLDGIGQVVLRAAGMYRVSCAVGSLTDIGARDT